MGRVDEAMRRAAEARQPISPDAGDAAGGPTVGWPAAPAPVEAFSSEGAERPRPRPVTTVPEILPSRPPASGAPSSPVGERIAADLANKIVVDSGMDAGSREQYRRMAATLHALQAESGLRVITVASAMPGEGKTLTAANLALTLSESYQRKVLLIDGDLRKPSQHAVFGLPVSPGLTEGVVGTDAALSLHRVSPTLTVITAGEPTDDPMVTLAAERMQALITEAREQFDWIVIDTPPVGLLPDAGLISGLADGTVVVVRADATQYDFVQRSIAELGRERILGVVLNLATPPTDVRYGANYGRYAERTSPPGRR